MIFAGRFLTNNIPYSFFLSLCCAFACTCRSHRPHKPSYWSPALSNSTLPMRLPLTPMLYQYSMPCTASSCRWTFAHVSTCPEHPPQSSYNLHLLLRVLPQDSLILGIDYSYPHCRILHNSITYQMQRTPSFKNHIHQAQYKERGATGFYATKITFCNFHNPPPFFPYHLTLLVKSHLQSLSSLR